jgi:hypothetical protein
MIPDLKKDMKDKTIMKLPCGHCDIEITRTGDQIVVCPVCHKRGMLVWSQRDNKKIQW